MNHLALLDQNILELVSKQDLVLVDTGYFDYCPENYDFTRELYEINTLYQLESFVPRMQEIKKNIDWRLSEVISRRNVYTIPEVIEEISHFEQHLEDVYSFHQKLLRTETRTNFYGVRYYGYEEVNRFKNRHFVRRMNLKKEKTQFFAKEDNIDFVHEGKGVSSLENLLLSVRRVLKETKVYYGPRVKITSPVLDVSEADYRLIETALGYVFKKSYGKVLVLTSDCDLGRIMDTYQKKEVPAQQIVKLKGICICNIFMRELEINHMIKAEEGAELKNIV